MISSVQRLLGGLAPPLRSVHLLFGGLAPFAAAIQPPAQHSAQGGSGGVRRRRRRLEWPADVEPERSLEDEEALLLGIV